MQRRDFLAGSSLTAAGMVWAPPRAFADAGPQGIRWTRDGKTGLVTAVTCDGQPLALLNPAVGGARRGVADRRRRGRAKAVRLAADRASGAGRTARRRVGSCLVSGQGWRGRARGRVGDPQRDGPAVGGRGDAVDLTSTGSGDRPAAHPCSLVRRRRFARSAVRAARGRKLPGRVRAEGRHGGFRLPLPRADGEFPGGAHDAGAASGTGGGHLPPLAAVAGGGVHGVGPAGAIPVHRRSRGRPGLGDGADDHGPARGVADLARVAAPAHRGRLRGLARLPSLRAPRGSPRGRLDPRVPGPLLRLSLVRAGEGRPPRRRLRIGPAPVPRVPGRDGHAARLLPDARRLPPPGPQELDGHARRQAGAGGDVPGQDEGPHPRHPRGRGEGGRLPAPGLLRRCRPAFRDLARLRARR